MDNQALHVAESGATTNPKRFGNARRFGGGRYGSCDNGVMTYRICAICTGNICRSPLAEVVLREAFEAAGLADQVVLCSSGTGPWHIGDGADHRAVAVAARHGLDLHHHQAQQADADHLDQVDLALALDSSHQRALRRLNPDADIRLLRSFDPAAVADGDLDVADPYYGSRSDFESVYDQLCAAAPEIVAYVRSQLTAP